MLSPAGISHIPLIRELAHRIWPVHYGPIIGMDQVDYMLEHMYSAETLLRQMTEEGHRFWLVQAPEMSAPGGYMAVRQVEGGSYFLHKFYLDNHQRGKGLGSRAFEALLKQYSDLHQLRLLVNRRNFKSINFYFKIGFVIERYLDTPFGDRFVLDDYEMIWKRPS